MNKIKVLAITRSPINSNDNLGSSLEKILGQNTEIELSNIYLRSEKYNNDVCSQVYQIPEQDLLKSLFTRKPVGSELKLSQKIEKYDTNNKDEVRMYNFAKKVKLYSPWFVREILWSFGRWKNESFDLFLSNLNPDIVFFVSFNCWYPYKVLNYVEKKTKATIVCYHVDDNYTFNHFSPSPFYWIYRSILRRYLKKTSHVASVNYCISKKQKEIYDSALGIDSLLLQKTASFDAFVYKNEESNPLRFVFTGNISSGRWKTLSLLGRAFDDINGEKEIAFLEIYTQTRITSKMKAELSYQSIRKLEPAFPDDIQSLQNSADVLVHVESFSKRDINDVRLSFSTKIVDYVSRGRVILAIGPSDDASIQYFIDNRIGFVISKTNDIKNKLVEIIENKDLFKSIAFDTYEKGRIMHDSNIVSKGLINTMKQILADK